MNIKDIRDNEGYSIKEEYERESWQVDSYSAYKMWEDKSYDYYETLNGESLEFMENLVKNRTMYDVILNHYMCFIGKYSHFGERVWDNESYELILKSKEYFENNDLENALLCMNKTHKAKNDAIEHWAISLRKHLQRLISLEKLIGSWIYFDEISRIETNYIFRQNFKGRWIEAYINEPNIPPEEQINGTATSEINFKIINNILQINDKRYMFKIEDNKLILSEITTDPFIKKNELVFIKKN